MIFSQYSVIYFRLAMQSIGLRCLSSRYLIVSNSRGTLVIKLRLRFIILLIQTFLLIYSSLLLAGSFHLDNSDFWQSKNLRIHLVNQLLFLLFSLVYCTLLLSVHSNWHPWCLFLNFLPILLAPHLGLVLEYLEFTLIAIDL